MSTDVSHANEQTIGRSPCLPVAMALAFGIAADHVLDVPRAALFITAGSLVALLVASRRTRRSLRVATLLFLFAILGMAAHAAAWRDREPSSLTRLIDEDQRLVRLTGTVASSPLVERRRDSGRKAAWPLEDRTRILVEASSLADESNLAPEPVSGRVQVTTIGHLIHVGPGDEIEVIGWLARPGPPRNPGGFAAAEYLRLRRIDATLYADHPDAVRRLEVTRFHWRQSVAELRNRLSFQFAHHLSVRNGPVGAAMILGDRSTMPLEIRDAYINSGAMHILAISGMNVAIFAIFLTAIGRLLNFSSTTITLAVLLCVWAYALLTDLEPPVVRAAFFLSLWALATAVARRPMLLNTVAATVLVLLLWDPLLLFDLGAQLSFLAVLGMGWSVRALPSVNSFFDQSFEDRPWLARVARPIVTIQVVGLGAWLFTAPLIAARFGIVSPVGFLLNVALIPLATVVMWCGYAFFGVCLLLPFAAGPFGALFDLGLTSVNALVVAAGQWRLGHLHTLGPSAWWLIGFYVLLCAGLIRPAWAGRRSRSLAVLLGWTALGLTAGLFPAPATESGLRLTAIDVGHGSAVLVEAPDGRTLLFDCGGMEDDRRAAESVWRAIRLRGRTRIDAVVLSHADLDHCNNVPALLRGGPVGMLAVSRSFLDFDQSAVVDACEAARENGVPIRLLSAGDMLDFDPSVDVTVLHPPDRPPGGDDNANSVVLRLAYGGRTVLLPGDLEGPGQDELFEHDPRGGDDVLLAPHHGGLKANTPSFAAWSRPTAVVVSSGDRVNAAVLEETYPTASRLLLTPRHGAVTVTIDPHGRLAFETAVD